MFADSSSLMDTQTIPAATKLISAINYSRPYTMSHLPDDHCVPNLCSEDLESEVFELELDWTPPEAESIVSKPNPSNVGVAKLEQAKAHHGSVSSEDCQCKKCVSRVIEAVGVSEARGIKRSPGASPPTKKLFLLESPHQTPIAVAAGQDPTPPPSSSGSSGPGCPAHQLIRCEDQFSQYMADTYAWKRSQEDEGCWVGCQMAMANQPELRPDMRHTLLSWLMVVNRQFSYSLETWCLTASLIDRFLAIQPLYKDALQLGGLTAFFIAAKAEEVDPPTISELIRLCNASYDRNQFQLMEFIILSRLKFQIQSPTVAFFLHHKIEFDRLTNMWPYDLSMALVEKILCDAWLSGVAPSLIAEVIFNMVIDHWHLAANHDVDQLFNLICNEIVAAFN